MGKKAKMSDLSTLHKFTYSEPKVIAEIGCNHRGEIETAKELLTLAKEAGATVGKFQKRCPKELLTPEQYNAPHPNPQNSFGSTYGEHREFLELSLDDHRELQKHCQSIGIEYSCSTWDLTSAREIVQLNPCLIKVGSPSNTHWDMMEYLRDHYAGEVHISTGMTTKDEIEEIVKFWEEGGHAKDRVVLYNCTSGYPVPFKDVCLLDIRLLQEKYQHRGKCIGFSGHRLHVQGDRHPTLGGRATREAEVGPVQQGHRGQAERSTPYLGCRKVCNSLQHVQALSDAAAPCMSGSPCL